MSMELETINKLFLELSQFATAKTERELKLEAELAEANRCKTPDTSPPPLVPESPRRDMLIRISVSADFEKRLDNQWEVEREIHADRWSWEWADQNSGTDLIRAERERQISQEGWTSEQDDQHTDEAMAFAAATYALPEEMRSALAVGGCTFKERLWPFDDYWFKPSKDRIRDLTKAGALIAAEIDRLQRLKKEGAK